MVDEYSLALQQAKEDIAISIQSVSKAKARHHAGEQRFDEGIWAYDVQNDRIYWSNSIFEMLGIPRQEFPLTFDTVLAFVFPPERPILKKLIQSSLNTGNPFEARFEMRPVSGRVIPVQLTGKVYLDNERKPIRISGRMMRVVARKQSECSLQEMNHHELADIWKALDESAVLSITDRYGIITYMNDAFCRISQYSREELIAETLQIVNYGYHSKLFFEEMWDTMTNGTVWRGDIKNRSKEGITYWMDTTIVPLLNVQGEPFQYIVIRYEITRQKVAEQEVIELRRDMDQQLSERTATLEEVTISQSREIAERKEIEVELKKSLKQEKLIKHLIQLINRSFDTNIILEIAVREIGTFLDVDRCMVILHNREANEESIQKRLSAHYYRPEIIEPGLEEEIPREMADFSENLSEEDHPVGIVNISDTDKIPSSIRNYLESQDIQSYFSIEIKYRNISFGQLVLHQCSYPRVWTEKEQSLLEILAAHIGAALYQVKLYQEEKKAKQEAEEANRQKSKILSFVSHDFKNPLASMGRFIEILENDKKDILSEKHREVIGYIADGVHQLHNMVINILDKTRLAEGKIIPLSEWIALKPFVNELKPLLNSIASERKIDLNIEIQPGLTEIKADPIHLRQILINLISNACKYNRINGKTSLKMYKPEDKQAVVIEVQDSGFGIAPEKMPQIFIEYFRGNLSQSTPVEGSGLGLAFIKKLVELQGGTIHVESQVNVGSIFTVTLPNYSPV